MAMPDISPECRQCGECCRWSGFVYVDEGDIHQAALFLRASEEDFIRDFTVLAPNRNQLCLAPGKGDDCVFLEGNRCRIYPARPAQCRDFPARWGCCPCRPA